MAKREKEECRKFLESLKEILKEDDYPVDVAGNTRLTLLAQEIKKTPPTDNPYKCYVWAIQQCAELLPNFSLKEIINLCDLMQLSEIPSSDYHDKYFEAFKRWEKKENNTEARAEIFRLICESGAEVTPYFVNNEVEIKEKFLWHWIDAAAVPAWDDAIKETEKQLKKINDVKPLLLRLPRWWNLKQDKDAFYKSLTQLISAINSEVEVMKIRNYLEFIGTPENKISEICRRNIMLQDNDYLKDNPPAYQLLYPSRADSSQMNSRSSRRQLKEQRAHV